MTETIICFNNYLEKYCPFNAFISAQAGMKRHIDRKHTLENEVACDMCQRVVKAGHGPDLQYFILSFEVDFNHPPWDSLPPWCCSKYECRWGADLSLFVLVDNLDPWALLYRGNTTCGFTCERRIKSTSIINIKGTVRKVSPARALQEYFLPGVNMAPCKSYRKIFEWIDIFTEKKCYAQLLLLLLLIHGSYFKGIVIWFFKWLGYNDL